MSQKTNLVTDWDGKLREFRSSLSSGGAGATGYYWKDRLDASTWDGGNMVIETGDFDFGVPGIKKNLYAVYITHKLFTTATFAKFRINGEDLQNFQNTTAVETPTPFIDSADWVTQKFVPASTLLHGEDHNLNYVSIYIANSSKPAFGYSAELKDITIVYRVKGLR